jgi:hyaluronan synthase
MSIRRSAAGLRGAASTALRGLCLAYLAILIGAIAAYKVAFIEVVTLDPFFAVYGLVVCAYILSRFVLSLGYTPGRDRGLTPQVAIVMPAFNEEEAIASSLRSLLAVDYPSELLEIVAVDDGSDDGTLREMRAVAAAAGGRVRIIEFARNRGKRAAMAAGIRATTAEVIAFVDSDSELEPDALYRLVQHFADPGVGAVAGHADVLNTRESWITKLQAVRYFVAFKVMKAAESVFGAVSCCSGCFAAYRRAAIMPHLDWWEHQRFLGREATFGDDRSLTNCVLRDWRVPYEEHAVSRTIVPATIRQFLVQQIRWKRSWTRESLVIATFVWRKHPVAAAGVYVGIVLPLLAPFAATRAMFWRPLVDGAGAPLIYLLGVYAMALVYSLYYAARHRRRDTLWLYGIAFVFFYLVFLVWQTYYAIVTSYKTGWGTRVANPDCPSA